MQLLYKLVLIVALLMSAASGSHAGVAEAGLAVASGTADTLPHSADEDVLMTGAHNDHCQKNKHTKSADHGHDAGCCIAACSAFEIVENGSAELAGARVQVALLWTLNSREGVRPERLYRPPEA